MRTVLFASLRNHTRRYVAGLAAVTIAVTFVVVINALGSGARSAIAADVENAYPGADLIIGDEYGMAQKDPDRVLDLAAQRSDTATVVARAWTEVAGPDGAVGADVPIGTVALDPSLRSVSIAAGRAPKVDDEALVATSRAKSNAIAIGDHLTIGTGSTSQDVTVVGLTTPSSYLDSDVYLTWPAMKQLDMTIADSVIYAVGDGDVSAARQALADITESSVQSRDDYVDARIVMMNQGVDVLSYLLLLFAAIAGFVAILVIANTFTILFAQRSRDFALLRCVGATRRQVLKSVRIEALVLAFVAATTGLIVGVVGGYLIGALVRALAGDQNFGPISFSPVWLTAAFVGGVITTVVAAWFPTRSVVRVSPLTALRPAQEPTVRTTAGRVRVAIGGIAVIAGFGALVLAAGANSMPAMVAGGVLSFVGVLLLGPVIVPALLRLTGHVAGPLAAPIRIAAANAIRNPRRSAATTASLLVGVTLATAVLTGMASARQSVEAEMSAEYPVDLAVSGKHEIDADTVDRVRGTAGVNEVLLPKSTRVQTGSGTLTVAAPSDADRGLTLDPRATDAADSEILIPNSIGESFDEGIPDRLTLRTEHGRVTLATRLVPAKWGDAAIVSPAVFDQLTPSATSRIMWIMAQNGANADDLAGAVGAAIRGTDLEVTDNLQDQQWVARQLDVLVWSVLGLLAVGIAIALVGIANTVGLSVLERAREHALLRALGLTRRGLRRTLAAEGMLLAVVAALLGTILGVTYAWFGVSTVVQVAMPDASLVVPWAQLAGVLAAAALAGLASCVLPARRAARIMPAEGLTLD